MNIRCNFVLRSMIVISDVGAVALSHGHKSAGGRNIYDSGYRSNHPKHLTFAAFSRYTSMLGEGSTFYYILTFLNFNLMEKVGNNGSRAAYHMHNNGTLLNNMTLEQAEEILRPDMVNPKHLDNDDFWEDFIYTASELGYSLSL